VAGVLVEQIRERLWPAGPTRDVWAILDGARNKSIYWMVRHSFLESTCLFSGDLSSELEQAAPYLIQLDRDDELVEQLVERGWADNWGVFFKSGTSLNKLRRHLREFLRVRDTSGKRLLFRYYDPRVLRIYLPTCTTTELRTVFGPIETFWAVAEDPSVMLDFSFDGNTLTQKSVRVQPRSSLLQDAFR